jgi:hypothetical protein
MAACRIAASGTGLSAYIMPMMYENTKFTALYSEKKSVR